MKVLMVSKALVAATYQSKLAELARLGVELTAVVPPVWIEEGSERHFEPAPGEGYRILVSPLRFNGRFHLHSLPGAAGYSSRCSPRYSSRRRRAI